MSREIIDQVAIDRVLAGVPCRLTYVEKRECARQAVAMGCDKTTIARAMGVSGAVINEIWNEITQAAA